MAKSIYRRPDGRFTSAYNVWKGLRQRCLNKNCCYYPRYGGRGITVSRAWNSFATFLSDMGERPGGKTLERRDNSRGYSKVNCYWATPLQQNNNRRGNRKIRFLGEEKGVAAWERDLGFARGTILARLNRGWSPRLALSTSPRHYGYR